jgi:transposase
LSKEQVMVAMGMQERGTSVRQLARQFGVSEGTLRYRLKRTTEPPRPDGRAEQATALDGLEAVVEGLQERMEDARLTGEGRPCQVREIYEVLARDHGYRGSYQAVVRHLRRKHGPPRVRALRRVETPPGVQAQHDWYEVETKVGGREERLQVLTGTLSHSRARIDNLKTGVSSGAGATAVLNASYRVFARTCGFEVDPCRAAKGSDKGKVERSVRTFRSAYGSVLRTGAESMEDLQRRLDVRSAELLDRLTCPVTGTRVREAWETERAQLRPLPTMAEPFDVVVGRRVSRDCLISFEGRRYSVPFAWVGRQVEVLGTHTHVVVRAAGTEIARHARGTRARLLLAPEHYEGESTDRVERPTPLGRRARLQMAGLPGAGLDTLLLLDRQRVARPLDEYVRLVEALR